MALSENVSLNAIRRHAETDPSVLSITRGIEREALRVHANGHLAMSPHPVGLGSPLTHRYVTTDYSEALPELITPPIADDYGQLFGFLGDLHTWVAEHLASEWLWNSSMPCFLEGDESIPIANYGTSNPGQMKRIYRVGLGYRYGRTMQTIAGVHYNMSFSDAFWRLRMADVWNRQGPKQARSQGYMGLIRNFLRHQWLLVYLFGASPALCESFLRGRQSRLKRLDDGTRYGEWATSLRMSDLGYVNNAQTALSIGYDSLEQYIAGLEHAIRTPEPLYERIGVKVNGEYRQLNANLLQIENEFYSSIRPKRVGAAGERPAKALARSGVEYVEVRAIDVNPFSPWGISLEQAMWLDCFLVYCAVKESAPLTCRETGEYKENLRRVVGAGRSPHLSLWFENREVPFAQLAENVFQDLLVVAEMMDALAPAAGKSGSYVDVVGAWRDGIYDERKTLSAKVLDEIRREGGFSTVASGWSRRAHEQMMLRSMHRDRRALFVEETERSREQQRVLEADDSQSFEDYLAAYFA